KRLPQPRPVAQVLDLRRPRARPRTPTTAAAPAARPASARPSGRSSAGAAAPAARSPAPDRPDAPESPEPAAHARPSANQSSPRSRPPPPPPPLHRPAIEPLARRLKPALTKLTRVRIKHHRLKHRLLNINLCLQHLPGPPFLTEVGPRT